MFDVKQIRKDFPMIQNHPDLVYFDNGATTFKPQCVIDAVSSFYQNYNANVHRGDYDLSIQADKAYDGTRKIIASLLNCDENEIAFMHNDTECLNQIIYGLSKDFLHQGDIVFTTEAEHASNLLPWYRLQKELGIQIQYMPVSLQGIIQIEEVEKMMNDSVKVISIAHVTNVLGSIQPVEALTKLAHQYGARIIVDGAQSVPHMPVDVKALDIDYLTFSAHKMCGPDGVGVLYGKKEYLTTMQPLLLGGGMNARFDSNGEVILKEGPEKFEAGTPNIEGVIGLGEAAKYLMNIGLENIHQYEQELRAYFVEQVKALENIELYNPDNPTGMVTFNAKDVFAQDAATYLASKNIAVRSGNHCAKILHEIIGTDHTIRASLYFYNTKEEVDYCVQQMKEITIENAIGVFI